MGGMMCVQDFLLITIKLFDINPINRTVFLLTKEMAKENERKPPTLGHVK